ncbi:MAG: Jag N-terminal domain-containing protein, partial [Thermodesulfobacteriota bacterium]|nr:Jag N-terminal domain-containing protein [Thermodesulfobacteriota bacterium]
MSEVKEFTGKDVDEAIDKACDYFNAKREKLEIEIQRGGSTGIFGLVGVKKAVVKARVRDKSPADEPLDTPPAPERDTAKAAPRNRAPRKETHPRSGPTVSKPPKNSDPAPAEVNAEMEAEVDAEVKELVETVLRKLLTPIIGDPKLVLQTEPGRV